MLVYPPAAGVLKIVYSGTYGGAKWANVWHAKMSVGPLNASDVSSMLTQLQSAYTTNIAPLVVTSCTLTNITVTDLTSDTGATGASTPSVNGTFASATALPASAALVCSFKISRRYRGGHPRMYLPGQANVNTVNSINWTGTWAATAGTGMNAWRTAIGSVSTPSSGTLQLVSLSYFSNKALRATPVADPVTTCVIHTRIDTQRRRLGKEIS